MSDGWVDPRSDLLKEIELVEDEFLRDGGDYGYGGEWFPRKEVDTYKVEAFILDRERRLLDGMTLDEFLARGEA